MEDSVRKAILAAVDEGFAAQIELTQKLVAQVSYSQREAPAQELMATTLGELGWDVDRMHFRSDEISGLEDFGPPMREYDETFNVVGTLNNGGGRGRSLIINGHVDVVPTGDPASWTTPPFEPRIADGKLYGRGSGDMKGGLVAGLFGVEAVRRAGFVPMGRIHLQSVIDEEGSGNGTLACVARGYRADAALVLEPTAEDLLCAQLGIIWFFVEMRGTPQHASGFQGRAPNVIEQAFDVIAALRQVEKRHNLPENRHPAFADNPHAIRLNVGQIEGGNWPSSSPGHCNISGRISVYPGAKPADIMREMNEALAAAAAADPLLAASSPKLIFRGNRFTGYTPSGADEAKAVLASAHRHVFGRDLKETAVTFGSDARALGLVGGIPSLVYGPISQNLHGIDECVDIESLRRVAGSVALFVAEWCGIEPRTTK